MRKITCAELGGACSLEFVAETFEEVVELSQAHGMKMFDERDLAHLDAMEKIMAMNSSELAEWQKARRKYFYKLPVLNES